MTLFAAKKDSGAYLEKRVAGLRNVRIQYGRDFVDFSNHSWGYQVIQSFQTSSFFHLCQS